MWGALADLSDYHQKEAKEADSICCFPRRCWTLKPPCKWKWVCVKRDPNGVVLSIFLENHPNKGIFKNDTSKYSKPMSRDLAWFTQGLTTFTKLGPESNTCHFELGGKG